MDQLDYFATAHLEPVNAAAGLALEEALFEHNAGNSLILLLSVHQPAVVLGKHQNPWLEANIPWLRGQNIPVVRRISGGGCVYHDGGNLNYSFMGPSEHVQKEYNLDLLIEALGTLGIQVQKNQRGDLLFNDKKVSGNALCHKNGKTLHHGTLLINSDLSQLRAALGRTSGAYQILSSATVASVRSHVVNMSEVSPHLTVANVAQAIQDLWKKKKSSHNLREIPENEIMGPLIDTLMDKYLTWDWNFGRTGVFEVRLDGALDGAVETIRDGLLENGKRFDEMY